MNEKENQGNLRNTFLHQQEKKKEISFENRPRSVGG